MNPHAVTIIVPVYGDWASLCECLESLKSYINPAVHKVLLVNDCGPDAEKIEREIKKSIRGHNNFVYYRNKKNLGFVQNCNNAVLNLDKTKNDILLLNSDTKVTKDFLQEMLGVLYSDKKIAVVSPRSNNATIATIPLSSAPQKGIGALKSHELFVKIKNKLPPRSLVPTAHGFCMLIRRELIEKYGLFDEVFGKGYGEEVDFCQRVRLAGYKCALANHAYVFHQEARSFSLEAKAKLLEKNNKIIWQRYPNYRQEVRDYMESALKTENAIDHSVARPSAGQRVKTAVKRTLIRNKLSKKIIKTVRARRKKH